MNIEINKIYKYFDDDKINESRISEVLITEIIPFDLVDKDILALWKEEIETYFWLYANFTDYFIKGKLKITENHEEEIIFVRTINNNHGWFSMGDWAGRLDHDGSLFKTMLD